MALEINFYLAPMDGDGLTLDTAWRCRLKQYVNPMTERYHDLSNRARLTTLALCYAEPTTHQTIQADVDVTRMFPGVSFTAAQVAANIDRPLLDLMTPGQVAAYRASIEAAGVDTTWATAATTFRHFLRRIKRYNQWAKIARGNVVTFLARSLDETVAELPAAVRTAAQDWMAGRGLDTGWITGETTVRSVRDYVVLNDVGLDAPWHGI